MTNERLCDQYSLNNNILSFNNLFCRGIGLLSYSEITLVLNLLKQTQAFKRKIWNRKDNKYDSKHRNSISNVLCKYYMFC